MSAEGVTALRNKADLHRRRAEVLRDKDGYARLSEHDYNGHYAREAADLEAEAADLEAEAADLERGLD